MTENTRITAPVKIRDTPYFDDDAEARAMLEKAEIHRTIAQHVYDLRACGQRTQEEFAQIVNVAPSVIEDLEESAYEGDSLAVLAQIEKAFLEYFEPRMEPAKAVYPNVLLGTTITGFRFRYFRYHLGRTVSANGTYTTVFHYNAKDPQTIKYLVEELAPWQHALERNRKELRIFALADITEWCHLNHGFYIQFSGNPDEHICAVDTLRQGIDAFVQYLHTGERVALKQWRQDVGQQELACYLTELENALHDRTFVEFPDTEWLVKHLIGFVAVECPLV